VRLRVARKVWAAGRGVAGLARVGLVVSWINAPPHRGSTLARSVKRMSRWYFTHRVALA